MRHPHLLMLGWALLFAGSVCLAQAPQAQMLQLGVGVPRVTVAPGYAGPGDVVTLARYWGLRCYTTAYTGSVADVFAPADVTHTLLTCSTGGVINETIQALSVTCAVSCTVKTLFDQPNFGGSPQDQAQTTEANRLAFIQSCSGSKPCLRGNGTSNYMTAVADTGVLPIWGTYAAKRTGNASAFNSILKNGGTGYNIGFSGTSGNVYEFAGNVVLATASENNFHAVQNYISGSGTDSLYVDGSLTGSLNAGTTGSSGSMEISGDVGGQNCTCDILEVGFASSNQTANNSAMNSNQHSYWGF